MKQIFGDLVPSILLPPMLKEHTRLGHTGIIEHFNTKIKTEKKREGMDRNNEKLQKRYVNA